MKWEEQSKGTATERPENSGPERGGLANRKGPQARICPLVIFSLWTLEGAVGQHLGGKLSCEMVLYARVQLSLLWSSSGAARQGHTAQRPREGSLFA